MPLRTPALARSRLRVMIGGSCACGPQTQPFYEMAGRSRINRMLNLVEEKGGNNSINSITEESQYSREELVAKSQKLSSLKTLPNSSAKNSTVNTQPCQNELLADCPNEPLADCPNELPADCLNELPVDCPKPDCSNTLLPNTNGSIQPQPGELQEYSPTPGCSKHFFNDVLSDRSLCENTPGREHGSDIYFTADDETFLVCFDIVSSLVDSLPCFYMDYSSGSDDDYVLDTNEESSNSDSDYGNQRRRYRVSRNRQSVVVSDSDPEDTRQTEETGVTEEADKLPFWDKVGVNQGRKRKPRKSEKERRKDREDRKKRRNLGKEYETNKGKKIRKREFQMLKQCKMKCAMNIPEEFRKKIFESYWTLGEYSKRVQFIANLIELKMKNTQKLESTTKNRNYANQYYLKLKTECYRICRGCFLTTFDESSKFVQGVTDKLKISEGFVLDSSRGKMPSGTKISESKLEAVKEHISLFPAYESHYGRSKTNKKFLAPHLCLTDMYKAYREVTEDPVSETIYSWVFKSQNLSFKKPYLDTCLKCDTLESEIKFCEGEESKLEKERLKAEHVKKAESIYDRKTKDKEHSRENPDILVAAFDLQQCLPTPYLKTGAVFYKRQLWTFNLTIRDCTASKSYCFMWHEGIAGRGGNQIASCVYKFILDFVPDSVKHLVFYSDSCFGQNKNFYMVTMFLLAVRNHPSLETITHNFFVPGHSHMECDVDHAMIEKAKKKTQMDIHHPRDWYQLVRTCGKKHYFTVIEMDNDLFLEFGSLLKGPFVVKKLDEEKNKFLISDTAIFRYSRENFPKFQYQAYESEGFNTVNILRKRGKSPMPSNNFDTENIPRTYSGPIPISVEKKRDLMFMLNLINPSVRSFYENLLCSEDVVDSHPLAPTEATQE